MKKSFNTPNFEFDSIEHSMDSITASQERMVAGAQELAVRSRRFVEQTEPIFRDQLQRGALLPR